MSEERRKLKRWHLVYYLRVFGTDSDKPIGHLVDISTQGIMLISEEPIDVGSEFQFRMILPSEIEGTKEVNLSAESRWSEKDPNPDFYNTGFQLKNLPAKDTKIIESLIRKFNINEPDNTKD